MKRLPGTGLELSGAVKMAASSLVVCGESPSTIFAAAEKKLAGWQSAELSFGFREFYFKKYTLGKQELNVLVGGLGSASIELILQEGTLAGGRKFLLTGTCASLQASLSVGNLFLPSEAILRPGAFSEYRSNGGRFSIQSSFQEKLRQHLMLKHQEFNEGCILSTDAFYGLGGLRDANGQPIYAGAKAKQDQPPEQLSLALDNPFAATALDMECAVFFALGNWLADTEVAAVKVVSNHIPWDSSFNDQAIAASVESAVALGLDFLLTSEMA